MLLVNFYYGLSEIHSTRNTCVFHCSHPTTGALLLRHNCSIEANFGNSILILQLLYQLLNLTTRSYYVMKSFISVLLFVINSVKCMRQVKKTSDPVHTIPAEFESVTKL